MIDLSKKEFIVRNPKKSKDEKIKELSEMVDTLEDAIRQLAETAKVANKTNAIYSRAVSLARKEIESQKLKLKEKDIIIRNLRMMLSIPDDGIMDLAMAVGVGTDELRNL